ncbi:MAG: flagellar motor protein MotB [Spirochaetaceae bacterium]|jgi:chemotaxis protein MotB|nr:flagellar motor protein MotB [Spirochaetaceae bacterium]GMO15180.1 MAG: flagellar motor protein MotB [Termitinemataceae bacterium]
MAKKKKKDSGGGPTGQEWLTTYSDMVTLVLCFFAIMFNPDEVTPSSMAQLTVSFMARGMGANTGGNTLSPGRLAELGNNVLSLPATDKGKSLGTALKKAISLFTPEIHSKKMTVTSDERGIVISLASDVFFEPASARINIEQSRDILLRLASLLSSSELFNRKFRIEGHTDSAPIDPAGPWTSNWQLSSMRSIAVLEYLTDTGLSDRRFQVAGFADTVPLAVDDTPEGRAFNRRVDVIILDEGHL